MLIVPIRLTNKCESNGTSKLPALFIIAKTNWFRKPLSQPMWWKPKVVWMLTLVREGSFIKAENPLAWLRCSRGCNLRALVPLPQRGSSSDPPPPSPQAPRLCCQSRDRGDVNMLFTGVSKLMHMHYFHWILRLPWEGPLGGWSSDPDSRVLGSRPVLGSLLTRSQLLPPPLPAVPPACALCEIHK